MEVDRSDRQARRRQGKSDPLDAVSAARAGGFAVTVSTQRILGTVHATLALDGVPESGIRLTAKDLAGMDPVGLVIRLENRLTGLEALKTKTLSEIGRMRAEIARAREDSGRAFPQADQLVVARERAREIERQLEEAAKPTAARVVTPGSRQCRGRGHRISA